MAPDYTVAHVLLPFLAQVMEQGTDYRVGVSLVRDGSMRFAVEVGDEHLDIVWSEHPVPTEVQVVFSHGAVHALDVGAESTARSRLAWSVCEQIAPRLSALQRGSPPDLLLWRNRNVQKVRWGTRMLNDLCSNLLVKGRTRYFGYRVTAIDEYEGLIRIEMESRQHTVRLQLTLTELLDRPPICTWGPTALVLCDDDRTDEERASSEHQVEEFVGYVLSRSLPPHFRLTFDRDDPPGGHRPPDFHVDLLRRGSPDDSSWFEMLLASNEDIALVGSCDRECFNLFSFVAAPGECVEATAPWTVAPSPTLFRHTYHAHLTGLSTVFGNDRPARCLDAIAALKQPPKLVVMVDSCLSRLIGEDIDGTVTEFRAKNDAIPLVLYDVKLTQEPYLVQVISFWRNVLHALADRDQQPEQNRVCLLGIDPAAVTELAPLLARLGVTFGGALFPHLDPETVRLLPRNGLMVVNNWHYTRTVFSELLAQLDRPALYLPMPYGIEGTRDWLRAVATAAGVSDVGSLDDIVEIGTLGERLATIRERILGHRLALVGRYQDGHEQFTAEQRFGVPLLEVFRELGLAFDVNLFVEEEEEPDLQRFAQQLGLDPARGDSIAVFDHWKRLREILAEGDFPLVYTETYRDGRVLEAGKIPVGVSLLRPGLGGALANAHTIQALLGTRFYSAYRRYFTDPYGHYRSVGGQV